MDVELLHGITLPLRQGRRGDAEELATSAADQAPESGTALLAQAILAYHARHYADAVRLAEAACAVTDKQGQARALRWKANALRMLRRYGESLEAAEPSKPKGGRPRLPDRACLTGILFVLRTGIPWEYLPQEMGCGSGMTCWRRLRDWQEAGVWEEVHPVLMDRLGAPI